MAHFRGVLDGTRGSVSKLGSKIAGLSGHVDGWESGVSVLARYNSEKNLDEFDIYATNGSSNKSSTKFIATVFYNGKKIIIKRNK